MFIYIPSSDDFSILLNYVDLTRNTENELEMTALIHISDIWLDQSERVLDAPWPGKTVLNIWQPQLVIILIKVIPFKGSK